MYEVTVKVHVYVCKYASYRLLRFSFIDPLIKTGFSLTMSGQMLLAQDIVCSVFFNFNPIEVKYLFLQRRQNKQQIRLTTLKLTHRKRLDTHTE